VLHYSNQNEGNPYVLAFSASVILILIPGRYWIPFRGGARALVGHPGMFKADITSPAPVKLIWKVCLLGGITAFFMMFTKKNPIPKI